MKTEIQGQKKTINPYVMVILSFLLVILVGSVLLTMPWTQQNGQWAPYIDALVTAVSATCVTGVATYETGIACTLSFGGQLVTIIMVQIGGLGFVTLLTFFVTLFNSKLQFKDRYLISQMVSSTNFADVVKFLRKVILIEFICEFAGFLLGLPVFLNMYPDNIPIALWNSLFHSISSFNNAGFDLFNGTTSLVGHVLEGVHGERITGFLYYYFCTYIMLLITLGGISFLVIIETVGSHKNPRQWRAFTKIVLTSSAILLVGGSLCLFLTDGFKQDNPMTFFDCLFQSVTCRTAGFMTYLQDDISAAGRVISCLLMFVGGSPLSTAGGIKTTTIYLIVLAMVSYFSGKSITSFKRHYSSNMVIKAMSLMFVVIITLLFAFIAFTYFGLTKYDLGLKRPIEMLYIYEIFSCFGTVGFFTGIEPYLTVGSKITICLLMFIGRLGPITFFSIFQQNMDKKINNHYEFVEEDFLIG